MWLRTECSECEGQGGGARCRYHYGAGCPCAVEWTCRDCDGLGYLCDECGEPVNAEDVCRCLQLALPFAVEVSP